MLNFLGLGSDPPEAAAARPLARDQATAGSGGSRSGAEVPLDVVRGDGMSAPPKDDALSALHMRFRADLDAAPLDELREAAQTAAAMNASSESAGGWKLHVGFRGVPLFYSSSSGAPSRVDP